MTRNPEFRIGHFGEMSGGLFARDEPSRASPKPQLIDSHNAPNITADDGHILPTSSLALLNRCMTHHEES